jgi:Protein of unknown function (DUF3754)
MAEYEDREHYIPLRKSDLVELLSKDPKVALQEREPFRQFCKLVGSVWHFEYLETLEKLKDDYAPFDPDSTCKPLKPLSPDKRPQKLDHLFDDFVKLMERANFKRLSKKDVEAAVEGGASDWGINMNVNFDVFERLELFIRGEGVVQRTKKHPIFRWRKETKKVDSYQRLALMVKLRKHKRIPEGINVEGVFLKMFKDIPKLDLEMVLPGTTIQMPSFTRLKLGGSAVGTIGYGLYSVGTTLIMATKQLLAGIATLTIGAAQFALLSPFALLGGYAYKQYAGYQITRQTYAKMLTESLYYQNLDNNAGVMTQVLDEAEEQECRETILAYFYLWKYAPREGWTSEQLDDYVEMELEGKVNLKVDFEVDDAMAKLEKLNIVQKRGDHYHAVSLEKALEMLDYRWDNYFKYNNPEYEAPPVV